LTRLFVSLELPELVQQSLAMLCNDVPGARWAPPEQIHLTLRFIGDVDGLGFQDVGDALASVRAVPFELVLRGVGHFPPRGEPRTLWAGVEKSEPLLLLHDRIESALVRVGLERERRKFAPHVSLARLRGTPTRAVVSFLARNALFRTDPIPIDEFHLVSSQLTPKHAVHRNEGTYPLGGQAGEIELGR
jgi:RNA 2',3'-cyclic 3'-phosphodiesterase